MKRNFLYVLSVAIFLGLRPLAAASEQSRWELGLHPGYAIPIGESGDIAKGSFNLQVGAGYRLNDWVVGGLEIGYSFGYKLEGKFSGGFGNFTSDIHSKLLQITPIAKIGKEIQTGRIGWTPYGIAGAGLYLDSSKVGTVTLTDFTPAITTPAGGDKWVGHFGFNVGAGLDLKLAQAFSAGLDVRYHHYLQRDDTNLDGKRNDPVQILIPSLRLTYLF